MTFRLNRWTAVAALLCANCASAALTVQFSNRDLADQVINQDLWSRSYVVKGDLARGLELDLLFGYQVYSNLRVSGLTSNELNATIVQPDAASMGDGLLALEALRDLGVDSEFKFDVTYVRTGVLPLTQPFVVYDRANEQDVYRGTATLLQEPPPGTVAEPSSASAALLALVLLGTFRSIRSRFQEVPHDQ
jgi:hypothetical protein